MKCFKVAAVSLVAALVSFSVTTKAQGYEELFNPSTGITESQIRAEHDRLVEVNVVPETRVDLPEITMDRTLVDASVNDVVEYRAARVALLQAQIAWYGAIKASLVSGRELVQNFELSFAKAGAGGGSIVVDYAVLRVWLSQVKPTVNAVRTAMAEVEAEISKLRTATLKAGAAVGALVQKGNRMPTLKTLVATATVGGIVVGQVYALTKTLYVVTMSPEQFEKIIADLDATIAGLKLEQQKLSDPMAKSMIKTLN